MLLYEKRINEMISNHFFKGYVGCVKMLVEFASKMKPTPVIVNSLDNNGSTVLHISVKSNDLQLLRYLLTRYLFYQKIVIKM